MSETMTRDFEKQFPLPFEYDSKRNIIKDKNGKMMMLMPFAVMTLEQIEHCDALGTYLAACANLMPEAVEIIETFIALYEEVGRQYNVVAAIKTGSGKEIKAPLFDLVRQRCEDFLAKFEKEPE